MGKSAIILVLILIAIGVITLSVIYSGNYQNHQPGPTHNSTMSNGTAHNQTPLFFENAGNVSIDKGSSFTSDYPDGYVQISGATMVNGNLFSSGGVKINDGLLYGNGTVTGDVENSAYVAPNVTNLSINGNYVQSPNGTLIIHIYGPSNFSKLHVTGSVMLNGTVNFVFSDNYTPAANARFAFLQAKNITGDFKSTNFSGINCTNCSVNPTTLNLEIGTATP
jgi:hypothetical protein